MDHVTGAVAGGLNAGSFLKALTVHDDGAADKLTGASGMDLFFMSLGDSLTGKSTGENVVWV